MPLYSTEHLGSRSPCHADRMSDLVHPIWDMHLQFFSAESRAHSSLALEIALGFSSGIYLDLEHFQFSQWKRCLS